MFHRSESDNSTAPVSAQTVKHTVWSFFSVFFQIGTGLLSPLHM